MGNINVTVDDLYLTVGRLQVENLALRSELTRANERAESLAKALKEATSNNGKGDSTEVKPLSRATGTS